MTATSDRTASNQTTPNQTGSAQHHLPTVDERRARAEAEQARESTWARPSFAKELYLGRLQLDLIHPMPRLPDEEVQRGEAFLARLRTFCAGIDNQVIEHEARIPDEYVKGLAELGAFGMKIPREYGGLGLSMTHYGRALMLVGTVNPSISALLSAHQSIGVPEPVRLFGTEQQKQEFLPRCARGAISAFLLTEPDVGSDPARVAMAATPTDDEDSYLLDGVKLWTTNGVVAELLVVMARVPESDGHRGGVTAFVVEADSPGITVEHRNSFMGLRGIENGVTRFHQVRVPASNRLGEEGQGLKVALTTLNAGRLSIPAMCTGAAKWSLKVAREWTGARVQWGRPIGKHAAVSHKVAYIAASAFGLESVLELSAHLADEAQRDIRLEAAIAKLYSSEMAWKIVDELVQIRGGRGYETAESLAARGERPVPVEQILRDVRINRIFEGSTEIMHLFTAREAVDAHLQAAGDLADRDATLERKAKAAAKASGFYARWLPNLVAGKGQLPGSYAEFGDLAPHLRYVERSSRKLARNTFYGMARWQAKLELKQGFLARVVDIGAELFAITATCVHARTIAEDQPERADAAYELAEAFCAQARQRADGLFGRLWHNTDAEDERLSRRVLDERYGWLEEGVLHAYDTELPWIAHWEPGPSQEQNQARRMTS